MWQSEYFVQVLRKQGGWRGFRWLQKNTSVLEFLWLELEPVSHPFTSSHISSEFAQFYQFIFDKTITICPFLSPAYSRTSSLYSWVIINSFLTDFPASSLLFPYPPCKLPPFFPLSNLQSFQTNILKILLLLCYSSVQTTSWFPICYYIAGYSRYSWLSTSTRLYSSIPLFTNTHPTLCHTIYIFLRFFVPIPSLGW